MSSAATTESRLRIVPITLREANAYIKTNHRHHKEARGCISVCAVADENDVIRGVAVAGRPVARMLQDGFTAEVTRVCTDDLLLLRTGDPVNAYTPLARDLLILTRERS